MGRTGLFVFNDLVCIKRSVTIEVVSDMEYRRGIYERYCSYRGGRIGKRSICPY